MYIWPDGSVTGSVNHAVLEAYLKAKENGDDLSPFEPYLGVLPEPESSEESDDVDGYSDWSLAELQDEAVARGLPKSGNKAEVADRLREDDAQPDEEE